MGDQESHFIILAGAAGFSLISMLAGFMWRRPRSRISLRHQLLFAVVGAAAVSVFLIVSILVWRIRVTLTDQIGQAFVVQATSNSQRLGVELTREIDLIRNLSEDEVFFNRIAGSSETELTAMSSAGRTALLQAREQAWPTPDGEPLRAAILFNAASTKLAGFRDNFPAHTQLLVTDRYGSLVAAAGLPPAHYYYGHQTWWLAAWQRRLFNTPYVGGSQVMSGSRATTVDIAVTIHPPETPVSRGLLRSRFIIDALQVFADADPPGETGELNLVDETGLVLYSSNPDRVGGRLPPATWGLIAETPSSWREVSDGRGQAIILGHAALAPPPEQPALAELDWTVVVQQAKAEALATVNRLSQIALLGGAAALALVAAVGSRMMYQLIRPIEELTTVASALAEDHLESRAAVSGPEELRTLAQTFNQMAGRLQQTLETLEQRVIERTRRLEIVALLGERLNAILNLETLLVEIVEQIKKKFDYYHVYIYLLDETQENLVRAEGAGGPETGLKAPGYCIPLQAATSLVARTARTGQIVKVDAEIEGPDWSPPLLLPDCTSEMAAPIMAEGQVMGVLGVQKNRPGSFDENEADLLRSLANQAAVAIKNAQLYEALRQAHDQLEDRVKERTAELTETNQKLEAKNAELERFTYTVSHDLKSPLITIRGFLGFVEQAAMGGDIERVRTDMARIAGATEKMEQLLNEVLEISRIGRLVNPSEATPLTELAYEAVEMVRGRLEKRGVEVIIAPDLPVIYGDRPRLREVLENLVDNAVKYMGDQPAPRVEIGVKCDRNEPVFYVRDNGIGIEPRYHKKIFGLFDKLDQQTEGAGVGLTIVQRIVELHGGQIWIESEGSGQGSVFCFTLQTV